MLQDCHRQLIAEVSKKDKVLICGTGPSIDCLRDSALVTALEAGFSIFAVNTAHHYFKTVDVLFIGTHCGYKRAVKPSHFAGKTIKFFVCGDDRAGVPATFIQTIIDIKGGLPPISTDITMPLAQGPTTILDFAVPTALFCGARRIFLLGAEYPRQKVYRRFDGDSIYRTQEHCHGFAGEMDQAHAKWKLWAEHFRQHNIEVIDFSTGGELSFPKLDIYAACGVKR